jgi:paraquat-inducible protein A
MTSWTHSVDRPTSANASDAASPGLAACHVCGALHAVRPLPHGAQGACRLCGAVVYRERGGSLDRALALNLAAALFFVLAHLFPFMTLEIEGREQVSTLISGTIALYEVGMWPLAVLVGLTATALPAAKVGAMLLVLLPIRQGRLPRYTAAVFRLAETARPWAMLEVYLLGVIVAYVKLSDLATIELGLALYAFIGLIVCMAAAEAALDPRVVWERLGRQATWRAVARRQPTALIACHGCGQVVAPDAPGGGAHHRCPRCSAALHKRKPDSLNRTWALLLTAAILYIPANIYPVMTVVSLGKGHPDTILSGVATLIAIGMYPVAVLVFFASIVVPVMKLVCLVYLLLSVQRGWRSRLRDRSKLYRIVEGVGRWSMVDIFMIAILTALVDLGSIATIEPGIGVMCFAAVVVVTMAASMSFDPRLMWDTVDRCGDELSCPRA